MSKLKEGRIQRPIEKEGRSPNSLFSGVGPVLRSVRRKLREFHEAHHFNMEIMGGKREKECLGECVSVLETLRRKISTR